MESEEDAAERYFEALAGRGTDAGAEAMRAALLARSKTLNVAAGARLADLDGEEREALEAARRRLIEVGIVPATGVGSRQPEQGRMSSREHPSSAGRAHSLRARFRTAWLAFAMRSWAVPAMSAAVVVVCGLMVLQMTRHPEVEPIDTVRGNGSPILSVPHAGAKAEEIAARLRAQGADVVVTRINEREWSLVVDSKDARLEPALRAILIESGVSVTGGLPFEFAVREAAR